MHLVDHIVIFLLFIVQPVYGYLEAKRYEARARAGEPLDRMRLYRQIVLVQWTFLAALIAAWLAFGRPIADLGVSMPGGPGFWAGAAVLVPLIGYLLYAWGWAKRASAEEKARQVESIGNIVLFVPHTRRELRSFVAVSITAGIVEEFAYRAFVLWYLVQIMPLWVAVAVSAVAFGLGHSYQGAKGALHTGLVGLASGILYVVSGSIWLPIVAHIVLDILQGATLQAILSKDDHHPEPQPA